MASKGGLSSPDFNASLNNHQNEREGNDSRFSQGQVKGDAPKKKTTFKITSVTKSVQRGASGDLMLSQSENDLDSMDDLDETSHTEDLSSEIFDTNSRLTDADSQDPLLTPDEIVKENEPKEKPARFKVVKVETREPFKRGRWMCCDYLDAPDHKMEEITIKPGSSTTSNSVHYVHGVDDPSKNPLLAGATGTTFTYQQPFAAHDTPLTGYTQSETFRPIQPAQSNHTGLTSDPAFSGHVAQSSVPVPAYAAQLGVPNHSIGQSLPVTNISGGGVPLLPPMQQGETQTSQSLSGNIPFPTPGGQAHQLPIPQGSMYNGHSQPASVGMSVTSPHQPTVQIQDYVKAVVAQGQVTSQDQHVPAAYQQQMLYQDISSRQSGYNLSGNLTGTPFDGYNSDGPQLSVNGTSLANLTSRPPDGIQDTRPNLGVGLAQIAVGGISTAAPNDDDVTEEAVSQSRQPPIASRRPSLRTQVRNHIGIIHSSASAVAIDNKIEQAMVSFDSLKNQLKESSKSSVSIESKVSTSMDLVKSHLMYAVREEVEVLKEVIKELVDRMQKVEQENKVLRSEASHETLARLPPPQPPMQNPLLQQFMVSYPAASSSSSTT